MTSSPYPFRCLCISLFLLLLVQVTSVFSTELTDPAEIIRRVDENLVPETSRSETVMIIHDRGRLYEKQMTSFTEGKNRSYTVFSSPPRDRGSKYLKINDNLWMYLPSVERVIKISGHMLRQSMMGSDFSYEDILEARKLLENYDPALLRKESLDERECYVIELTAVTRNVTYYRRVTWIDTERFVILRSELYAKTGKLLKVFSVQKVKKFEDRYYPVEATMEDKIRKNTKTHLITKNIAFNVVIDKILFSRQNLERRR